MDYQEALGVVKEFYDHAWNNLLWLNGIAFGAIGIVVPVILTIAQARINDGRIKKLEKEYAGKNDLIYQELMGMYYLMQGNIQLEDYKKEPNQIVLGPNDILLSYLKSLNSFLGAKKERQACVAAEQCEMVLTQIKLPTDALEKDSELKNVLQIVIKKLEKTDDWHWTSETASILKKHSGLEKKS